MPIKFSLEIIFIYCGLRFIDFFFIEGIIKPFFADWGNRWARKILPKLYQLTDKTVLQFITDRDEEKIIRFIKEGILLIDPNLNDRQVDKIVKEWEQNYSPIEAIKHGRFN